jgi:ABC-type transport system involved in multi-copper enzyme maturation permease subunit
MSSFTLGWHIMKERLSAGRMLVIWPLLAMFILFSSWGLSDPKANLPTGIVIDSAYDVMFASTAFIVFSATMGAVLISFDGISRDRLSGVLEVKLSQPIQRSVYARALLIGHWCAIFIPVLILNLISLAIIWYRMNDLPSLEELFIHTLATGLLLLWYTSIQLLASSWAKDMGASIAVGLGVWMLFTLLWLVLTTLAAGLLGVGVENLNSPEYIRIEAIMDLFSPNGVYHHLLEMPLSDTDRGISPLATSIAAVLWSILPLYLFIRRTERMHP